MHELEQESNAILKKYVIAAGATGAVPVPAVSAALVAENALMVTHIAAVYHRKVDLGMVAKSMGILGAANMFGRSVFIEGARALSWGAAFTGAPLFVSALGASTAALQTYLIGLIAIALAKYDGQQLPRSVVKEIVRNGKQEFNAFYKAAA